MRPASRPQFAEGPSSEPGERALSRETDKAPFPQDGGRGGGTSYPSGTPPYGTQNPPAAPGTQTDPAAREPKTETTLTTRVRINIPGSRPIPPVVVRKTVNEGEEGGESNAAGDGALPPGWDFPGAATEGRSGAPAASSAAPGTKGAARTGAPTDPTGSTGQAGRTTSDWFSPRRNRPASGANPGAQDPARNPGTANAAPTPTRSATATTPPPTAPGVDEPTAQHRVPPPPAPPARPAGDPGGKTRLPYQSGPTASGGQEPNGPPGAGGPAWRPDGGSPEHGGRGDQTPMFPGYRSASGDQGPGLPPPPGPSGPRGTGPGLPPIPNAPGAGAPQGRPARHAGPTTGPATGDMLPLPPLPPRPSEGEPPLTTAPPGSTAGYGRRTPDLTSDTLVSGIPAAPQRDADTAGPDDAGSRPAGPQPARRGRSKLVLAGVALVGAVALAYGAGLVLDHAQVPNGTTVLGVDIGGKSKQDAVDTLDEALAKRATAPLTVQIGDGKTQLKPSVVGLGLDTEATVRGVAHRDYNPVSVIGSLFGSERTTEPEFTYDEEKLRASLEALAAKQGSEVREGMVKFVDGEPVGVPGKAGLTLDVDKAVRQVHDAYLKRAETGKDVPVVLDRVRQEPKVTQAEIDRAIKEFGEPAMSGMVTVQVPGYAPVPFSPEGSLSQVLTMTAVNGKLEPHFDLETLEELYGGAFAGIQVDHGGSVGPVTPRDVASTMLPLLTETDPAKRIGQMEAAQ